MTPKIGESLRRVVSDTLTAPLEPGSGRFFSDPGRLACYQAVLDLALARPGAVARVSGGSRKSVSMRLASLTNSGFAERLVVGGAAHYSPSGAVDGSAAATLALAFGKAERRTLVDILAEPGRRAGFFPGQSLSRLSAAGLVAMVADGRHRRAYPGEGLGQLSKHLADGYSAHRAKVQRILHDSGANFVLNPLRGGAAEYSIGEGAEQWVFTIPSDPFASALSARGKIYK